ncbi:MAG: hypothetical protein QOE61_1836 [Micromonosporaceae bacterium]|nr:hypothetical protein [Micromonosporaceae bacterium]
MLRGRWGEIRRRVLWAVVPGAVAGVGAWAAFADDKAGWTVVSAAAAAVAGAFAPTLTERLTAGRERGHQREQLMQQCLLHLRDGRLPLVRDLPARDLGVKAAIGSEADDDLDLPTYVPRSSDDDLRRAVTTGGIVLVYGRAAVGKTRSAVEVVRQLRPDYQLFVPVSGRAVRKLVDADVDVRDAVIWLDDLERYLLSGGIDQSVLQRLCPPGRHDVVVVATIRGEELERLERSARSEGARTGGPEVEAAEVLQGIRGRHRVRVEQFLTEPERTTAHVSGDRRVVEAAGARVGFAEYLAAGPAMMHRWSADAGRLADVGRALISAAVDCRRAGYLGGLPAGLLAELYVPYLNPGEQGRADLPPLQDGVGWACERVLGASSCLIPQHDNKFLASDYLLDRTGAGEGPLGGRSVPLHVWSKMVGFAQGDELMSVASAAQAVGELGVAAEALRPLADTGDLRAMHNMGVTNWQRGALKEAEQWWLRAADAGHAGAMVNVGLLRESQGDLSDAEQWYRRAAAAGEGAASGNLGALLKAQGKLEEAEEWYRRGVDAGVVSAMHNLGLLLYGRAEVEEAERCWRRAAEGYEFVPSMHSLAVLLHKQGSVADAERWWRRAAEAGHLEAMAGLGFVLAEQGKSKDAERWLRRAADAGDQGSR